MTKLFNHQQETSDFLLVNPNAFITSDCGTGKTVACLDAIHRRKNSNKKTLVVCPKSIMKPSWYADIRKFYPKLRANIYETNNKKSAFIGPTHIVIINHDALKWLATNWDQYKDQFDTLVYDEFTAIKNRSAARSKAALKISQTMTNVILLSGTPTPKDITDIWHPAMLLDNGARLGDNFYRFRSATMSPKQVGPKASMVKWIPNPGAVEIIADALKDITIRHVLEDVIDMPKHIMRTMEVDLPHKLMKEYLKFKESAILELENTDITAVHAGVLANKLLQYTSGSVYDNDGNPIILHNDRYDLIYDLAIEVDHCVVVCGWKHQIHYLVNHFKDKKISVAEIRGDIPLNKRNKIIEDYQKGKYQVLVVHPAATAHGLTLTRGVRTIWAAPTYNLEHFIQTNHRIYRAGQKKRTETIMISAIGTIEPLVYKNLQAKKTGLTTMLQILKS